MRARDYDVQNEALTEVQSDHPELIGEEINVYEDIRVSRILRRTVTSQTQAVGVSAQDFD